MRDSRLPPSGAQLRVDALGPLRVWRGSHPVDLGTTKQRAVFATLALRVGADVSTTESLEAIWGDRPPSSARQLVHTYVARLRHVLEPDVPPRQRRNVITSVPSGYRLAIDSTNVDFVRFNQLFLAARRSLGAAENSRAFTLLSEAIRLWRDPSLTELGALLHTIEDLDALRQGWRDAALDYVTIGLEIGQASVVLPVARQLAAAEPMHEEVQAQYLGVLDQTGQRAAAIEHFTDIRVRLSEELGVAPGPQLRGAYQRLLEGAEQKAGSTPGPAPAARPRTPWRGSGCGLGELIERERELRAFTEVLAEQRLLTIAGPPGCGKSALAVQAAARLRHDFGDGVAVLECSGLSDLDELTGRLLDLLDAGTSARDVSNLLADRELLIVLDNIEHMVDRCATLVHDIVGASPRVRAIVASREPLGLPYETLRRVGPLTVPGQNTTRPPGENPAVQLFVRQARQVRPEFRLAPENADAIAMLCRRLDGLPLAIEMAAACLATDSVDGVVRRSDDPLREITPLRRGRPAHHHSLWSTLGRSIDCLNEYERWCFLQIGRLSRNFDLSQVQQVCRTPPWASVDVRTVLARLVNKSLLVASEDGRHYSMLRLVHRFAADMRSVEAV